jgi:hypothetical protein
MEELNVSGKVFALLLAATLTLTGIAAPRTAEAGRRHRTGSSISVVGTPGTSVVAGTAYSFTPTVRSALTPLSYSISNKPAWATFSLATGGLSGTPAATQVATYSNIAITVSNGTSAASLAPFSISVLAPAAPPSSTNVAPVISGSPPTSLLAGTAYSFKPNASDANGNALSFTISGMPSWASFNATTGLLSGTPTAAQIGSYANIVITVSDGTLTAALPAFTIAVSAVTTGSAALSWIPPTQNSDGSSLTNLAGYNIYYGTNASSLGNKLVISNPGLTTYTLGNLSSGTYYFDITAYTSSGVESAVSSVVNKTIL